jgi:hypothetical protein
VRALLSCLALSALLSQPLKADTFLPTCGNFHDFRKLHLGPSLEDGIPLHLPANDTFVLAASACAVSYLKRDRSSYPLLALLAAASSNNYAGAGITSPPDTYGSGGSALGGTDADELLVAYGWSGTALSLTGSPLAGIPAGLSRRPLDLVSNSASDRRRGPRATDHGHPPGDSPVSDLPASAGRRGSQLLRFPSRPLCCCWPQAWAAWGYCFAGARCTDLGRASLPQVTGL